MPDRHIVLWRDLANVLDWKHHVCEDAGEAIRVVENIQAQGVKQYSTYRLGPYVPELSCGF